MNKFIIFGLLAFILPLIFVSFVKVTSINDLTLNQDTQIFMGEGEACITPYSETQCQDGLRCKLISEIPYKNGVCVLDNVSLNLN